MRVRLISKIMARFPRRAAAFGIGHVHCNDLKHALCVLRQTLKLCCGGRTATRGKYAPSVGRVLTGKFEAKPTIGARDEDCCCHRMLSVLMNALLPHGFAEPRRFRKIACSYSAQAKPGRVQWVSVIAAFLVWRFVATGGIDMLRMMNRPARGDEAHHHAH